MEQASAAYTRPVLTQVIPFTRIYPAEKRHQKNQLKRHPAVRLALERSGIEVRRYIYYVKKNFLLELLRF
jgi:peptide methionine sulfoxide reductase MsrA